MHMRVYIYSLNETFFQEMMLLLVLRERLRSFLFYTYHSFNPKSGAPDRLNPSVYQQTNRPSPPVWKAHVCIGLAANCKAKQLLNIPDTMQASILCGDRRATFGPPAFVASVLSTKSGPARSGTCDGA